MPESLETSLRIRFSYIQHRVKHKASYVRKQIRNEFTLEQFISWSLENDFQKDRSIHRINRDGNYSPENCVWVTKEQHARITAQEQSKLNQLQVTEIKNLYKSNGQSVRKLARLFDVNAKTIWKIVTGQSYLWTEEK